MQEASDKINESSSDILNESNSEENINDDFTTLNQRFTLKRLSFTNGVTRASN